MQNRRYERVNYIVGSKIQSRYWQTLQPYDNAMDSGRRSVLKKKSLIGQSWSIADKLDRRWSTIVTNTFAACVLIFALERRVSRIYLYRRSLDLC